MKDQTLLPENDDISEEQNEKNDILVQLLDYEESYMMAFLKLLETLNEFVGMIYPTTFLLSHYMELWIKNRVYFIDMDYPLYDFEGLEINSHSVSHMLNDEFVIQLLLDNKINKKDINEVKRLYKYFDMLNRKSNLSESMRYPIKIKDNIPTIELNEIKKIDLGKYKENAIMLVKLTEKIRNIYMENIFNKTDERLLRIEYTMEHWDEYMAFTKELENKYREKD